MAQLYTTPLDIDPIHDEIDFFKYPISSYIWRDKYRQGDENIPFSTHQRVVEGIYGKGTVISDPPNTGLVAEALRAYEAMCRGLWVPAGRIHAGAGTGNETTLMNCYVCRTIPDDLEGIHAAFGDAMKTMAHSGGIGMDFSTIRPKGALVSNLGEDVPAAGPIAFMEIWDTMCATISQKGYRRGAMMGTLRCDHPDIEAFIKAKQTKGRLTNFNVSVLITDEFMDAVKGDQIWRLHFDCPLADVNVKRTQGLTSTEHLNDTSGTQPTYIYKEIPARVLWGKIMNSTYKYSEPGVIFIDRINAMNNLKYIETISCTNPCGEQPLPPNGTCNLGAVNLARMVRNPFTQDAKFDFNLLTATAEVGVRFLDRVIDETFYPLNTQEVEEFGKRRIGLGVTGLANALAMLGHPYNSSQAVEATEHIMVCLCHAVYWTSIELAKEKSPFPDFQEKHFLHNTFASTLPKPMQEDIRKYGIRNGVLLTIAPTGTTSIYYGNVSSGIEPVFAFNMRRQIRQPDGDFEPFDAEDYGYRLFKHLYLKLDGALSDHSLITHHDLQPEDHLAIQRVCQKYVDASISKTINCPEDITFEHFESIYMDAYDSELKGCTTYRPSDIRGSVLESIGVMRPPGPSIELSGSTTPEEAKKLAHDHLTAQVSARLEPAAADSPSMEGSPSEQVKLVYYGDRRKLPDRRSMIKRPSKLIGATYKIDWPTAASALYVTINDMETDNGVRPFEIFISSLSSTHTEWINTVTLLISRILRWGHDPKFIPEELKLISSPHDSAWIDGKFYSSLVARIATVIEEHLNREEGTTLAEKLNIGLEGTTTSRISEEVSSQSHEIQQGVRGEICPRCGVPAVIQQESCKQCSVCLWSNCE